MYIELLKIYLEDELISKKFKSKPKLNNNSNEDTLILYNNVINTELYN